MAICLSKYMEPLNLVTELIREMLGRVNASTEFFGLGAMLAGSLLGRLLGGIIGVRTMLFVSAFGTLLSALWLVLSSMRALRIAPPLSNPLV
jgi:hypothetical protein